MKNCRHDGAQESAASQSCQDAAALMSDQTVPYYIKALKVEGMWYDQLAREAAGMRM